MRSTRFSPLLLPFLQAAPQMTADPKRAGRALCPGDEKKPVPADLALHRLTSQVAHMVPPRLRGRGGGGGSYQGKPGQDGEGGSSNHTTQGQARRRRQFLGLDVGEISMYMLFFLLSFSVSFLLMKEKGEASFEDLSYPVVDPESCGDEEERVLNVFNWASSKGAYLHPNISTGLFPIPGDTSGTLVRGIKAKGEVKRNRVLFALPPSMLLNIGTFREDPFWKPKYENITLMRDGVAGLAVWLLRESMNKDSEWRPYICSLPRHVPLPLFYSESKLAKVRATLSNGQVDTFDALMEVRRDSFEVKYMRLVPRLLRYFPKDFSPPDYTYERFVWAASIILSRSWGRGIEDDDFRNSSSSNNATVATWGDDSGRKNSSNSNKTVKNVHTLAPAADMPNHSNEGHQALKAPDGSLVLRAGVDVPAGGQIMISYGLKCDAEVLSTYGFVPFNNSHVPCHNESLPSTGEKKEQEVAWRKSWREHFASMYSALRRDMASYSALNQGVAKSREQS